jgi:hypothetical protein
MIIPDNRMTIRNLFIGTSSDMNIIVSVQIFANSIPVTRAWLYVMIIKRYLISPPAPRGRNPEDEKIVS